MSPQFITFAMLRGDSPHVSSRPDPLQYVSGNYASTLSEFLALGNYPIQERIRLCFDLDIIPDREQRLLAIKWARRALSRISSLPPWAVGAINMSERHLRGEASIEEMKMVVEAADNISRDVVFGCSGEIPDAANAHVALVVYHAARFSFGIGARSMEKIGLGCEWVELLTTRTDTERQQQLQDILEVIKTINQSSND